MTWNMIARYPEYFAGAFPMSATGTRSANDVKAARDVSIWLFDSWLDPIVSYTTAILPTWQLIRKYNSLPENCRLSTFDMVRNPDGSLAGENHRVFQTINYDFFTIDGKPYPDVMTVDGYDNEVTFTYPNGMISWMDAQHSEFEDADRIESGKTGFFAKVLNAIRNFFLKIGNLFQKLFGFV